MKKILYFLLPLLLMTACHKNSYVARVTDVRLVSVDPKNGYPGDLVTLLGNNFSTDPEKNIVMLGGERARVLEAYSNRLLVILPDHEPGQYEFSVEAPAGKAEVFADGVNALKDATDYKHTRQTVASSTRLPIHLSSGGGWTAIIKVSK